MVLILLLTARELQKLMDAVVFEMEFGDFVFAPYQ
jgi:hypothetical protein